MPAIGQLEAFARAPVVRAELELHEAVTGTSSAGTRWCMSSLCGSLEQDACAVLRSAFGSQRGPRGVECGERAAALRVRLRCPASWHVAGEAALGERFEHEGFEFGCQRRRRCASAFSGSLPGERFALYELALDGIERRELVMARLQRAEFGLNAEQFGDELPDAGPVRRSVRSVVWG